MFSIHKYLSSCQCYCVYKQLSSLLLNRDSSKNKSVLIKHSTSSEIDVPSPWELKDILDRLIKEEHEHKEIKLSVVRKLTADMTERGRKLGTHLEAIHSYVVRDCSSLEGDDWLSDELADEIRKRTTSVDSEIKQLENQMGQLQRTLVKGKARRESIRHRISTSTPAGARKGSSISSSCSSMPEDEEASLESFKSKIQLLENTKLELLEEKKDLNDEIKFLKYQLQYRLEVQSLQNEHESKSETNIKIEHEIKGLREENAKLKERFTKIKERFEESGNVEESLLSMTDVLDKTESSSSTESELNRMYSERKILLSTIMRMQSMEKDDDPEVSYADFGVQCNLHKKESTEAKHATPLVAKLTKEIKALKKHIIGMQNEIDEREEESKTLDEENYKLTEEKRTLEDTINKLRTQMNETLDTTLDEIEHLHSFNEDLEMKFKSTEIKNQEILLALKNLQNNNCKTFANLLDQVENKSTIEEVLEYLNREVGQLIEQNSSLIIENGEKTPFQERNEEKEFKSNLFEEVKTCKELLESQRSHIRNLQLEKRDIEEGYTKMKRELLLLKSNKQRARENSKELQFLKKRRVKSLNDGTLGGIEAKDVFVDKESLQREVKRLGAVKTQLENNVQKLKKEKATLEDEKVCLLGSLYHQLERNESLEIQIEELTVALGQWEAKADLENDVFENESDNQNKQNQESEEEDLLRDDQESTEQRVLAADEQTISTVEVLTRVETECNNGSLDTEDTDSTRLTSPVVSVVGYAAEESLQELKQKIHALGEQLLNVQESVNELEIERDKMQEDLDESKKNEKELRNVIIQLKRENGIHLDKLADINERAETLQVRLREANQAKEEANEEKLVSQRHSEVLDRRLQEMTKQRDDLRSEIRVFNDKAKDYQQNMEEILELIDQINYTASEKEGEESQERWAVEGDKCSAEDHDLQECITQLKTVLKNVGGMEKIYEGKCNECDVLKNLLSVLNTEKVALHKSVREIDDKKKQMKGFIAKLTEEKEQVAEQLDEMKQQKTNLAAALENVYRSKEQLQNRFSEALCQQDKYKNALVEALEEVKNLKESLCRMVNEHETMKEALLEANREVKRLKSGDQKPHKTELDVIPEEKDKEMQDQNENELTSTIIEDESKDDQDPNINKESELLEIIKKLKDSVILLSEEKERFETRFQERSNSDDDTGESNKGQQQVKCNDEQSDFMTAEFGGSATTIDNEDPRTLQVIDKQAVEFKVIIEQLEYLTSKLRERDTDKDHLQRELESSSKYNLELLQDLGKMKEDKERIKCQLQKAVGSIESDLPHQLDMNEMRTEQQEKKWRKLGSASDEVNDLINKLQMLVQTRDDLLNEKELRIVQLLQKTKELQDQNQSLNEKLVEILENSKHISSSEELHKSIKETKALEMQVQALSNEGATLRGEADERVQRLIELEEKMIATMEKKLELAEYAKALKYQKDSLEKNYQQLSREVKGLKISRDQLLAGKELDGKLKTEIGILEAYKEKSIKEIQGLNKQLVNRKQEMETIRSKLDSEENQKKAMKEDLEKAAIKETELLGKTSILEQNAAEINKKFEKLLKEKQQLNELINNLINFFDEEVKGRDRSMSPESCTKMEALNKMISELRQWIVQVKEELKNQTNETNFLSWFVQHVDAKISELLGEQDAASSAAGKISTETPQSKENCDTINGKLQRLIEKLKEGPRSELEQSKQDDERISKDLASKSEFVQTVRYSHEQLLREQNVLPQKAVDEEENREPHHDLCNNCKKLQQDYDDLNKKYLKINRESSELFEKCLHLKEQLILPKQQGEIEEKEETKSSGDLMVPQEVEEYQDQTKPDTVLENGMKEIMHQHQRETNELKKEMKQLESELKELKKENEGLESLVRSLRSDKPQQTDMQQSVVERSSSIKDLNDKLGVSKNFMQKILDENTELKESIFMLEKETKDLMNELAVLKADIDLKKRALIQAKEETAMNKKKNHRLEEEIASLKEQLKTRRNLLATLEKDKEIFKVSLREAHSEATSLKKQNSELTDLLNSGQQRRLETENLIKKLKESCDEMTAKFEKTTADMKRNRELLEQEKEQTDDLKGKLQKLQSVYEKTRGKVEELTAELRKDKARRDREVGNIKQENAKLLADEGRADRECGSLRQQLDEERQKNELLADDIQELNKENAHLKKNLQLESDGKLKKSEELMENRKEGRRLSTLTGDLKFKIANLEAVIAAARKENEYFKEELDREKQNNADLRSRLLDADEDKEELEKAVHELREKRQKLCDEIDKTLAERDGFEDELIDTKNEMTKEIECFVRAAKERSDKVQQLENVGISLQRELEEYKQGKTDVEQENQQLKDNLEKMKTDLGMLQTNSAIPETPISSCQEKEDYIRQIKEGQYEIKKLTCALEKSKKEIETLKTECQKLKGKEKEEKRVATVALESLESCIVADGDVDKQDETSLSLEEQVSRYMVENMRLRARLQETDCKMMTLQGDLYQISKEGVQGELKAGTLQRECHTLRQTVHKYKENEESIKTALQASNIAQADLRRRLRNAIIEKEKYEQEYQKLMLEKGSVEKVTVTSIEMPAVSQIEAQLSRDHLAKAQTLETARKEIVILESQVKDLRARSESNRKLVTQGLHDISIELNRARNVLEPLVGKSDEEAQDIQADNLQNGVSVLRNAVDRLEDDVRARFATGQPESPNMFREKNNLIKELSDVKDEKNDLTNKLNYLQQKLSDILEERQVLQEIGADTRKELTALVTCLSVEREEKISISSEHSEMQAKLQEADKNEKALLDKIRNLEKECEKLCERNKRLEMKVDGLNASRGQDDETTNKQPETPRNGKQMTLESLCKDYKRISVAYGELEDSMKMLEDENKSLVEEMYAYKKKLYTKDQDLLTEVESKEQHLQSMHEENSKLSEIRKTLEAQLHLLDREVMVLKDRVLCSETEKERLENANRQQQSEIQELYLHRMSKDNVVREKLENLFYENTKLKEQKRMLVARLQSLELDLKTQLLTVRDVRVRMTNLEREKRRLAELLDKQEEKSRKETDDLTKMVRKLMDEKDQFCKEYPQLDVMTSETSGLEEECVKNKGVIDKLKEENATLVKENNLLRRACEKLKESRTKATKRLDSSVLEPSPLLRFRCLPGLKQSSLSSFDRASFSSSQHMFSADKPDRGRDYIQLQTVPVSSTPLCSLTSRDENSICSQECYCSPILSVVKMQQSTDLTASQKCPKCKMKRKTSVVISEHYV